MPKTKHIKDFLAEAPFFRGMPDKYIELLATCGQLARFKAGDLLVKEGEEANCFFLIRDGEVAIESRVPGGSLTVSKVGPEGLVGFSWLFPPHRTAFDARAVTDARTISLNGACLRRKAAEDHELGFELMSRFAELMLRRMQATRRQLLDIYGHLGGAS
jgi:CRP-like cAMP-binding protein